MKIPKEFKIQDSINEALGNKFDIYPYEIIYVDQQDNSLSMLKISVWVPSDIEDLKKIIGYSSLCDKTGYLEFIETNTVIFKGFALLNLMRALDLAD